MTTVVPVADASGAGVPCFCLESLVSCWSGADVESVSPGCVGDAGSRVGVATSSPLLGEVVFCGIIATGAGFGVVDSGNVGDAVVVVVVVHAGSPSQDTYGVRFHSMLPLQCFLPYPFAP